MSRGIDVERVTVLGTRLAEKDPALFEEYLMLNWSLTYPRVSNVDILEAVESGLDGDDLSDARLLIELRLEKTCNRRVTYVHRNNPRRN